MPMDYEKEAQELIQRVEMDSRNDDLETFYRGLATIRDAVQDRLMCATDELPEEVANDIICGFATGGGPTF